MEWSQTSFQNEVSTNQPLAAGEAVSVNNTLAAKEDQDLMSIFAKTQYFSVPANEPMFFMFKHQYWKYTKSISIHSESKGQVVGGTLLAITVVYVVGTIVVLSSAFGGGHLFGLETEWITQEILQSMPSLEDRHDVETKPMTFMDHRRFQEPLLNYVPYTLPSHFGYYDPQTMLEEDGVLLLIFLNKK